VRRVGGLSKVNDGLGYLENSYTLASIDKFTSAVNADVDGGKSQSQAAQDNKQLLVAANLQKLQPEKINSFEVGYKSVSSITNWFWTGISITISTKDFWTGRSSRS
jgi:outer membrane cobalamin receptor